MAEPIAVVGSGCRFAGGATSPSKLWSVLCEAPELSRDVPRNRFSATAFYHRDADCYQHTTNCIKGYWLDQDHRVFDANFFSITPEEAEAMDPQQRLLLEVVYEAMESAGFVLSRYSGKAVAVFAGSMSADHDTLVQRDELSISQYHATGNARAIIANRVSYFFNFQGPSMTIDTACSSSLVALHEAVKSLRSGESVMACVTGSNMMITPEQFIVGSSLHMLSPTGRCRMWDADADGYARGEGMAVVLLKPLSAALADGDEIHAIVRETGVNSDGRTKGITRPNPDAQADLIRDTYARAGLDPRSPRDRCQFFEAHGTGTLAGDPSEAAAISSAFFADTTHSTIGAPSETRRMLVGSVKTVIGHTEGAAGLAGFIKAIEAIKHSAVPPNLHLKTLNPSVRPFYSRLEVPTSLVPWPEPSSGQPRRASVNSFGFGGTNAHAIVESYMPQVHDNLCRQSLPTPRTERHRFSEPAEPLTDASHTSFFLPLLISAASQKSLYTVTRSYSDYIRQRHNIRLEDIAVGLYAQRTALPYRMAVSASSPSNALASLDKIMNDFAPPKELGIRSRIMDGQLKILAIFTGQGAQWPAMSRSLFMTNKVYRESIRALDRVLETCSPRPLWTVESQILADEDTSRIQEAAIAQPVSTALQIGMVDLLKSLRISFHTVIGHSSGEIAAAYAAGRLSARDAILIAYYRGAFAHLASGPEGQKGAMLAVELSESGALSFCRNPAFDGRVCLAASNSPWNVTISGDSDKIQLAYEILSKDATRSKLLHVDTAYHSPHMNRPAIEYVRALQACGVTPREDGNGVIWVSSVYGYPRTGEDDLDAGYWKDNMVYTVQFYDAARHALETEAFDCAIEVGPHPALKGPVLQIAESLGFSELPYCGVMARNKGDGSSFADFLGFLWSHFGPLEVDMCKYIEQVSTTGCSPSRLTDLPPYPWDHSQIHYRESRVSRQFHHRTAAPHELLGVRARDDTAFELRWRNILGLGKLPWVKYHSFQGEALLPASAYCIMALDAALVLLDGRQASLVELQEVEIMNGISFDRGAPDTETMFSLTLLPTTTQSVLRASFRLTSCPVDGNETVLKQNVSGTLHIVLDAPSRDALPGRTPCRPETLPADAEGYYQMMESTGLRYTGPFRGLASIERRRSYCSVILKRRHEDDTTTLRLSPATLDSCLQSAFLTYGSPGDKALWSAFLPGRIGRVRFNLATCQAFPPAGSDTDLTVDAHLVDIRPPTDASKSTFVVDIGVFNDAGDAEIQIEGLAVSAVAHTQPKEDKELYLHTVVDLDPTFAIARPHPEQGTAYDPFLIESCARVASFCLRTSTDTPARLPKTAASGVLGLDVMATYGWPSDTRGLVDDFISKSPYREGLDYIRELSESSRERLLDSLPLILETTHDTFLFHQHVGRIVRQIAHRYPRMRILSLVGAEDTLTAHILSALDCAFLSFTIGTEGQTPTNDTGILSRLSSGRASRQLVDLERELGPQLGEASRTDLVVLSSSVVAIDRIMIAVKHIRSIMSQGGFLVLVHVPTTRRLENSFESHTPTHQIAKSPEWEDALDSLRFIRMAKDSDQSFRSGFAVTVRQLSSSTTQLHKLPILRKPSYLVDNLLVVGGAQDEYYRMIHLLHDKLQPLCRQMVVRGSLNETTPCEIEDCTTAIIVSELEGLVTTGMDKGRLEQLHQLLRPNMRVLWVTCGARSGNPDAAALYGFVRTVTAEIPKFTSQILDFDEIKDGEDTIAESFIDLVRAGVRAEQDDTLCVRESEIYVENGQRLIPRILPLTDANERLNSLRRVVSKDVNTLQSCVHIVPCLNVGGTMKYEARARARLDKKMLRRDVEDQITIQVDYSSVEAVKLDSQVSAYLCPGRIVSTGKRMVALSGNNSSYVSISSSQAVTLDQDSHNELDLAHYLVRYLTATACKRLARNREIVLFQADAELAECVRELTSGEESDIVLCTTDADASDSTRTLTFHPRSTRQELRAMFPATEAAVFDLFPQNNELSDRVLDLIPKHCHYYPRSSLLGSNESEPRPGISVEQVLSTALTMALRKLEGNPRTPEGFSAISLGELLSSSYRPSPVVDILDWRADRNAKITTRWLADEMLFDPGKTYLVAGLTRDMGQSLCRLFVGLGARNVVLASRNPSTKPHWVEELTRAHGANIKIDRLDITSLEDVLAFKEKLSTTMPPVGGIINGAMVLDDGIFAQMEVEMWQRVLRPKTLGSRVLDKVFSNANIDFFVMLSSFTAIGAHPGQSNYATANMYMNGLAVDRRQRGLAASVVNMGVIYGLGFLQRERRDLYAGLEREGYPPISEGELHHMVLEAIVTGRPHELNQVTDLVTGVSRFKHGDPSLRDWQLDPRFCHLTQKLEADDDGDKCKADTAISGGHQHNGNLMDLVRGLDDLAKIAEVILGVLTWKLQQVLRLPKEAINKERNMSDSGVDSLAAVEIRAWILRVIGKDVAILKILGDWSISKLCLELANQLLKDRTA
ncbi:hypothetical protein F4778DRAFT_786730 [Xylariomycetidae sp. FL2044]|nr:hypothetical protein F4778DRAFT_786730 [Xylariomycetidae sp. FL2044]